MIYCPALILCCDAALCFHREMVNAWFAERVHSIQPLASRESPPQQTRSQQSSADPPPILSLLDHCCPPPVTAPSPLPGTPTRKISASEFDRPLRPIVVKGAEGSLTFLSDAEHETLPVRAVAMAEGAAVHIGRCGGTGSSCGRDRCARLLELVKEVSSHLDVTALCHKIFLHTNELIAADRYSLFLVGGRLHACTAAGNALSHSSCCASLCEQCVDALPGGRG